MRAAEGDLEPKLQPWRWLGATTVSVDNCRRCAAWWASARPRRAGSRPRMSD